MDAGTSPEKMYGHAVRQITIDKNTVVTEESPLLEGLPPGPVALTAPFDFYWYEVEGRHTYRATIDQSGAVTGLDGRDRPAPINATKGWEDARGHRVWDRIVAGEIQVSQAL